jgi:hypothetical protein
MSQKKPSRKMNLKKQKPAAAKKVAQPAKLALKKKATPKKKAAAPKKPAAKMKATAKKQAPLKKKVTPKKNATVKKTMARKRTATQAVVQRGSQSVETVRLKEKGLAARAGVGAGDYQGVSTVAHGDSESAEELLEEGQAFEAGIVSGVEDAGEADGAEVITHEVPQDDVPGEYDGKDRP